jgi:hypothetical protein
MQDFLLTSTRLLNKKEDRLGGYFLMPYEKDKTAYQYQARFRESKEICLMFVIGTVTLWGKPPLKSAITTKKYRTIHFKWNPFFGSNECNREREVVYCYAV